MSAFRGMLNPETKKIIPIAPYEIVYLAVSHRSRDGSSTEIR